MGRKVNELGIDNCQIEVPFKGLKVMVVVQQGVIVLDAIGSDQAINRFADCEAF